MNRLLLPAALAALSMAACTVGPNFRPPEPSTPPQWHDPAAHPDPSVTGTVNPTADPEPAWWLRFNDPELTSLIDRATQGNLDLKIAVQRIAESRYGEVSAASAGLPNLNAAAGYTRQQAGLDQLVGQIGGVVPTKPTSPPPAFGLFQGAVDASWEIDVFGKVRRSVEASKAQTLASIGDRDDSLVTLQAEIAQTYFKLRAAQASLAAAKADIAAGSDLLAITSDRTRHGLTSELDVKNALAQLASSQAQAPMYEQQIATCLNSLSVLVGEAPGALDAELAPVKPIPRLTAGALPVGLPSALARRRPDIRAAEARLHQQTADVGAAVAALYPDITITGQYGQQSQRLGNLPKSYNNIYSFGPSITLPIFQGGRIKANIGLAEAQQAEAALNYQKTVLSALQDVENALVKFRTDQQRLPSLQTANDANQGAVDISLDRYRRGLSTYIAVLNAQSALIQVQQQLIQAQLAVTNDLVTLYKALGGGWQVQAANQSG